MSDTKQIHFTLNLSKIKEKQIYDFMNESDKGQKAFFMDCVETCMNGGSLDAPGGEIFDGNSLILEKLQKIEYILTAGYAPPQERIVETPLDGQMEVSDYIGQSVGEESEKDAELDDVAMDMLMGLGD